ncbi:hypothetical protein [Bradyrhizobium sp. AZCC 2289]|uniref:hypothetical protein n=1 Tax=Bradyrhizobium sp. AZCC 2289 TaxID=3117026 RepID=UPI002FF1FBC3
MTSDHALEQWIFRLEHKDFVEEFIDRNQVHLADTFVPSAKYVAVGNHELLWLADPMTFRSRTRRSRKWVNSGNNGSVQTLADGHFLWVHPVVETGIGSKTLWYIERQLMWQQPRATHEVLAFRQGPTPIVFRDSKHAMALVKYCHPAPRDEADCMCWIPISGTIA